MKPLLLQIVLSAEQAAALWANVTNSGKLSGPAYTVQAIAQRIVEAEAEKAIRFFEPYPASMQENRRKFEEARSAPTAPTLAPVEDSEL